MRKETGLAHHWTENDPRWPALTGIKFCDVCGVCWRGDGRNRFNCAGYAPRIELRNESVVVVADDI